MKARSLLFLCIVHICLTAVAYERPIVVIIPSYNNQKWCDKNVRSVLNQKYKNFRVVYIDDNSTDFTANNVRMLKRKLDVNNRLTIICNEKRCGALANIYKAVHTYCADNEIVCLVDGDDWPADDMVLATINEAYADSNVWMTYGQFVGSSQNVHGFCRDIPPFIIEHNAFRDYDWVSSHMRTFYAGLFKKIRLQDLVDRGEFFDVTWDLGFMFPMLEMARGRHKCIQRILYVYNVDNPLSDFRVKLLKQWRYERLIRSFERYERIDSYATSSVVQPVDVVVISDNNPEQFARSIQSLKMMCTDMGTIKAVYCAYTDQMRDAYEQVSKQYMDVSSVACSEPAKFHATLVEQFNQVQSPYVMCMHDGCTINQSILLSSCSAELERTRAHGFYLSLGADVQTKRGLKRAQKVPPLLMLTDTICAWHLKDGEHDWRNPFSCSCAIYRTAKFKEHVANCVCDDVATLQSMLATEALIDGRALGLCYIHAAVTA